MPNARVEMIRLLKIHQLIVAGGYPSVAVLATHCTVNVRTIKRDIRVLREELDAPIKSSRSQGGYYYTEPFNLVPDPFTQQELLALSLSLQIADTFRNTPFVPAIKGALEKLRQMSAQTSDAAWSECISRLAEPAPPETLDTIIHFNELLAAIEQRQQVRMTYYTIYRDQESLRVVNPYHLYHYEGMWYVYGYCHERRENRDFAISRIRHLSTLTTTFTPPAAETIKAQLERRFTNVTGDPISVQIWFDPETARRIEERVWHPSQQIDHQPDGSCLLTLTVTGLESVTRWLLGYGRHARPLSPVNFVKKVHAEITAMALQAVR